MPKMFSLSTMFLIFFAHENMKKPASKFAKLAQIQPKSQFLFHRNIPKRDFSIMTLILTKFDGTQKPDLIHCTKAEAGCRRSHFPKEGTKQKTTVIAVNCTLFKEDRRFRLPHKKWCKNVNNIITKHHWVAMTTFLWLLGKWSICFTKKLFFKIYMYKCLKHFWHKFTLSRPH